MAIDIGAELRAAREAKGLSVATLAQRIRIQPRMIAAIERNDLSTLPPRPFLRGFVRAYAEEVDLDPEPFTQRFLSQFPAAATAAPPIDTTRPSPSALTDAPSQWAGLGLAAAVLLLVVTTAVVLGRRDEPGRDGGAVGTTGAAPAPAASASPAAPAATPPAASPAPAPAAPVVLSLSFTRPCWVAATVDGTRTIYRTMVPGETETLNAQRAISIRLGDAGAVSWTINGRKGEPLGANGAVRDLYVTPGNAATIR